MKKLYIIYGKIMDENDWKSEIRVIANCVFTIYTNDIYTWRIRRTNILVTRTIHIHSYFFQAIYIYLIVQHYRAWLHYCNGLCAIALSMFFLSINHWLIIINHYRASSKSSLSYRIQNLFKPMTTIFVNK